MTSNPPLLDALERHLAAIPDAAPRLLSVAELQEVQRAVKLLLADRRNLDEMRQCLGSEISYRQGGITWIEPV